MALLQGIRKLFGPLLDELDCVSAVKEAMEFAGRVLHVMALLQGIRKLFGPLLDDLWMTWTASVPLKTNKHHATISLQIFLIVNSPIN